MNDYVKIIGLKFDALEGLTIVQDANRKDLLEAGEYAQERDDKETLWLIVPCKITMPEKKYCSET